MSKQIVLLNGLLVVELALAACAPAAVPTKALEAMMEKTPDTMMEKTPNAMMEKTAEPMMEMPAWFSASLTNVATNESFKVQDFKGKVVLIETMAIWRSACLRQQKAVKALHDQLGERDDFVSDGQQFLNPPSAPMFIIDRHGVVHPLPFGVKSAADLQKALEPFLNEAM